MDVRHESDSTGSHFTGFPTNEESTHSESLLDFLGARDECRKPEEPLGSTLGAEPVLLSHRAHELVFASDKFIHWFHIFLIAGEPEAAEMPSILNRSEHGQMVECIIGNARVVNRVRINQRDHMSAARVGVAAAAGVAEAERTRAGEVALVPGDENHGIPAPSLGIDDGADCF